MILIFSESKWNDFIDSGKALAELLYENDSKKLKAIDVSENKKNRVTVAKFESQKK